MIVYRLGDVFEIANVKVLCRLDSYVETTFVKGTRFNYRGSHSDDLTVVQDSGGTEYLSYSFPAGFHRVSPLRLLAEAAT